MPLTRRRFLKQTLGFSAAALLSGRAGRLWGAGDALPPAAPPPDAQAFHFLAVGDFGVKIKELARQKAVADQMARYVGQTKIQPQALALLGDNFYGGLEGKGVASPRWDVNVESMYPAATFPCPMYAMLGNHDYSDEANGASVAAQLAYASHAPGSRWTMPSRWYRLDLPAHDPLVSFIVLDTNWTYAKEGYLSDKDRKDQSDWVAGELAKPRPGTWLFVLGHHPVFSDGVHGDTPGLAQELDPLLRQHKVEMYLSGHDHDLQHLQFDGHPTSFVISGAGGARTRPTEGMQRRGFGKAIYGFSHIELNRERFIVRHIDANGAPLHAFTKARNGQVTPA